MFSSILTVWLLAGPALAAEGCKARIAELGPRRETIQNTRTRELFSFDLERASKELAEGDEDECAEAVDHATQLLEMK